MLEDHAATRALAFLESQQRSSRCGFEDIVNPFAGQRRAFEVFSCANGLSNVARVFGRDEALGAFAHFFDGDWVFSKIFLQPDEDDGDTWTAFLCFFHPLRNNRSIRGLERECRAIERMSTYLMPYVFEGIWHVNRKSDENDMSFGVSQGP